MADYLKPDLCIVGGGAAGLAAAAEARALGASVVLIERSRLGGDLNGGSLPSKALAAAAAHAQALRDSGKFGMANAEPKPNFRAVQGQVQAVLDGAAPDISPERLAALGLQILAADAKFIDRRTLQAGDALIRAGRYILATGSQPVIPPIPGLPDVAFFTTDSIFDNARKLTHLLVIGGGPYGIELAQAHRRLGSVVTVVEAGPMLADADPELSAVVLRRLRDEGVVLLEHTRVEQVIARSQGIGIGLSGPEGTPATLDVSHVLVAAGRVANLESLDLGKAKVTSRRDDSDRLALSATYATSNRHIYLIGDAAGGQQQVLAARQQARIAVRHALLGEGAGRAPMALSAILTDPELAEVGLTEPQARGQLKDRYRVVRAPFAQNERAQALQRPYGVAKLICRLDGTVLGAGIAGPQAGELIAILSLAIAHQLSANDLRALLVPYPSLAGIVAHLGEAFYGEQAPSRQTRARLALRRRL